MLDSTTQQTAASAPVVAPVEMQPYSKRQQLLQALIGNTELLFKNRLEVRHLMTPMPLTISPTTTLEEMTNKMQERRVRHLLVCGRGGELMGVVSDRDLRPTRGTTAQQLMTYPPMTCEPDTPVNAAITFLTNENISCLPVVKHGRLCGILTTTDMVLTLQCMLQMWMRIAQALQHDSHWSKQLDEIASSLDGPISAEQLADRITSARQAIRGEVNHLLNVVDLQIDAVTGVGSRRELEDFISRLLAVRRRYERPFSVAIVVVDHFERICRACGDEVVKPLVKAVARLIEMSVREADYVGRWREDAFAVVLPETGEDRAGDFCRRLTEDARRNSGLDVELRLSAGSTEARADDTTASLLARAEAASHV